MHGLDTIKRLNDHAVEKAYERAHTFIAYRVAPNGVALRICVGTLKDCVTAMQVEVRAGTKVENLSIELQR